MHEELMILLMKQNYEVVFGRLWNKISVYISI